MLTKEMQKALEADGEKLRQLTGDDHGPAFVYDPEPLGYAFCCPTVGMYPCRKPKCRCVENWNAEREAEANTPERILVARAREYLAMNAAESGADVLILELTDMLEKRLPPIRQLATQ